MGAETSGGEGARNGAVGAGAVDTEGMKGWQGRTEHWVQVRQDLPGTKGKEHGGQAAVTRAMEVGCPLA